MPPPCGYAVLQGCVRAPIRDYVNYHHDDRIHDSLEKDTPTGGR